MSFGYRYVRVFDELGNSNVAIRYHYYDAHRKQFIAVDDYDGEGRVDSVVANYDNSSMILYLANGFIVEKGFHTGVASFEMVTRKFKSENHGLPQVLKITRVVFS